MDPLARKLHWDTIHENKELEEKSWYEKEPTTSLEFLKKFDFSKDAKIIDIGGGESLFVDHLLNLGFGDITVLDISEKAIEKAKNRLGSKAYLVKWVVADILNYQFTEKYDFWHDRAAFHFLTTDNEIELYIETAKASTKVDAYLVLGTFSEQGPRKCSGIEIKQYSEKTMSDRLNRFFKKIRCITIDHKTPLNTTQNFIFCSFKRLDIS